MIRLYELNNKVFKVVADQAANMKKAFQSEIEARDGNELQSIIHELLLNQKKEDLKQKERILREELENEIHEFNNVSDEMSCAKKPLNATELLAELMLDDSLEEITDNTSDLDTSTDTLQDADETEKPSVESLIDEFLSEDQISNVIFCLILILIFFHFNRVSLHAMSSA